jgi:glutamate synthase (NADPH/NADH) large chain
MTGGTIVVLGKAGMNFGAGMTGGLAWIYDAAGDFIRGERFHPEFIEPQQFESVDSESQEFLKHLIEEHSSLSDSGLAKTMLADWATYSKAFVKLTPKPQT